MIVLQGYFLEDHPITEFLDYSFIGKVIIATGFVVTFYGILGLVGTLLRSKLALCCYIPKILSVSVLLMMLSISGLYILDQVSELMQTEESCSDSYLFNDANDVYIDANKVFCSHSCPCSAQPEKSGYSSGEFVEGSARNIFECNPCESLDAFMVDLCMQGKTESNRFTQSYFGKDQQQYFKFLEWMETEFSCAGLCTKVESYTFSDVNNGDPEGSCREKLKNWIEETLMTYFIVSGIISVFLVSFT